ncbi:NUDIX domain-containing protein [Candidatus Methylospira mobilis]|uniref:ADP-ribose pyrophosphatase n=1 Tax=Candidatus Methylospira mobilis TaxID=1808979 RepID=A0A5Q0BHC6_9GAMM|nr:NUDIX domain-containing protein [Candidatus Methylospira mobilis]QFY42939.1 NUDIX domain-containing protein [Candidatus Methylospira mobilis]WNV03819.1 NUDIX domain-containing protein [Candidatus Methylospira mobilis]
MTRFFDIVDEKVLHSGFFNLLRLRVRHELFGGGVSPVLSREFYQRSNGVAVVLYDPERDAVVLLEQFRVGALKSGGNPWLLEIVAGGIEEGESIEEVAMRESREEAGCFIRKLIRIGRFYTSPGGSSEQITLFCGLIDTHGVGGVHGLAEEHEDIKVSVVGFAEAMALMQQGSIDSAIPIIGLQWLALNREAVQFAE